MIDLVYFRHVSAIAEYLLGKDDQMKRDRAHDAIDALYDAETSDWPGLDNIARICRHFRVGIDSEALDIIIHELFPCREPMDYPDHALAAFVASHGGSYDRVIELYA